MMRSVCLLLPALLLATPALAQSPFDGTWKADVASIAVTAKPDSQLLKDGVYTCRSCTPKPYSFRADGAFHAVAGKDYWDETALTIVDDRTIRRQFRRAGKIVAEGTETVSTDGNTITGQYSNTNNAAGVPVTSTNVSTRIGTAPAGAHVVSGEWKATPPTSVSDSGMQITLKLTGKTLMLTSPQGEKLNATIGGGYAPVVGDPGKTMTKVAMPDARTLTMTDMRGGKVVQTSTYTVTPDGATLTGKWKDPVSGATGGFTAKKQ